MRLWHASKSEEDGAVGQFFGEREVVWGKGNLG